MTMSKRKVTIIMRENRGTTSNTKEDRAGEGRQGHVELREHPGLGLKADRSELQQHRLGFLVRSS